MVQSCPYCRVQFWIFYFRGQESLLLVQVCSPGIFWTQRHHLSHFFHLQTTTQGKPLGDSSHTHTSKKLTLITWLLNASRIKLPYHWQAGAFLLGETPWMFLITQWWILSSTWVAMSSHWMSWCFQEEWLKHFKNHIFCIISPIKTREFPDGTFIYLFF